MISHEASSAKQILFTSRRSRWLVDDDGVESQEMRRAGVGCREAYTYVRVRMWDIQDKKCDEINYRYQGETHFFPRLFIEATIFCR